MSDIFSEISLLIIVSTGFALLVRLFRQPPLIGYILAGITLGPIGAEMIHNPELLDALREIGVALLLFLVGLELDWRKAKEQLRTASVLGIVQVIGSFVIGFFLSSLTNQPIITGFYIGLALAFASTVIVVKVLSESRDLNSLPGRLSVSVLLFQDFLAIVALTLLGGLTEVNTLSLPIVFLLLFLKIMAILALTWVIAQYLLPQLFEKIAHSGELLFLSSLAWCFVYSIATYYYGLPLEIGALLAGISLASLPYSLDILNRLRSLRDFFVILLFVALGSRVVQPSYSYLALTIGMIALTVFGKPLISFITLAARGYTSRTAFLTALTQGQLSEFSLLLVALGLQNKQINEQLSTSITVTAIISIFLSTILLTYRNWLYNQLRPILKHFERDHYHKKQIAENPAPPKEDHIIIFGYHRMGYHILKKLRELNHQVLVVDFNPDIVHKLKNEGIDCIYGDVQDEELLDITQARKAAMVISTIPHREETIFLISSLKKGRQSPLTIVTAHNIDDALLYYRLGASYVLLPHLLGGEHIADLIARYEKHQLGQLMRHRAEEIKLLRTRNHALYYD